LVKPLKTSLLLVATWVVPHKSTSHRSYHSSELTKPLIQIICSLIDEECLILVPSILGVYFLKKQEIDEKWSMLIVTLIGAFLFGMVHYSTYDGNLIQILLIIGLARLPYN
jgi:hypothetical protein